MNRMLPFFAASLDAQQAADSEQMLAEAGFHKTALSPLKTLPDRQLVALGEGDDRWYEFTDRNFCRCSYVGYDKSYAKLQELRAARDGGW